MNSIDGVRFLSLAMARDRQTKTKIKTKAQMRNLGSAYVGR